MRRISISAPEFTYDAGDPEGFRSAVFRIGPLVGADATGTSIYELPPGQALCPYHYEYAEEEWAMALDGQMTVRTPEGSEQSGPMEVVFFPPGPDGAHQIINDTDATVHVMMWSNRVFPAATAYPDSDKVGVWTRDKSEDVMVRRSPALEYFDGESR